MIKVLLIAAYPIQNAAPHRLLAEDNRLHVDTVYLSDPSVKLSKGKEFINQSQFDIKVLDDTYRWQLLRNWAPRPSLSNFWGLINPALFSLVPKYDCIVVYGHAYASFWMAILTALVLRRKLIFTTDATYLEAPDGKAWKQNLKKQFLPFLYNRLADAIWVPSTESKLFLESLHVKSEKIVVTPYTVDHDFFLMHRHKISKEEIREKYNIPIGSILLVFCAKFIARKRPQDALIALQKAYQADVYLLMIGDGPMRTELEQLAFTLRVEEKVKWVGLVKYSDLPSHYSASDILIFTSETEQFGLPVNEAMLCELPVIISDRLGCRHDLVKEGENGYTYKCGNTDELASRIKQLANDSEKRIQMAHKSAELIQNWSPSVNAQAKAASILRLFHK